MATEFVSGNGAPVVGVRGLSQVERVVDTFVSPTKTFTDILRNASWWLPFVLMLIGALGVTSVVNTKVGFERVAQNQIHASPKAEDALSQLDPAQREQRVRLQASIMKGTSYGFPVLLLIGFAVYSLLLWASFNFGLGAQTTYPQVLAVTWYAALPYLFISLITVFTVLFGSDADAYDIRNPIGTNLGYYLTEAPPMLKAALSTIDVFKLWSVVLQVIGMAVISRKSYVQSAVVVGIFWVFALLMAVGGAAFS